jgi:hypothetical protein
MTSRIFALIIFLSCAAHAVKITTTSLPNGTVGSAYSAIIYTGGGCGPYAWTATAMPVGLVANTSSTRWTMAISGTPTASGTFPVTVNVVGCHKGTSKMTYNIVIVPSQAPVTISTSPTGASLYYGGTQQFTGYVNGTTNTAVAWSATGGTVDPTGLYKAANTAGTYFVTATSQADTTKAASASVTISAPPQHSVSLKWVGSDNSVVGYNVFRSTITGGPYSQINTSQVTSAAYTDLSVSSGSTYYYVVTTVDAAGDQSVYSNETQAVIPTP